MPKRKSKLDTLMNGLPTRAERNGIRSFQPVRSNPVTGGTRAPAYPKRKRARTTGRRWS